MNILVACEYSGTVREAFRRKGHNVVSCDLLPSDDNSPHHIIGDVSKMLRSNWDLVIAHPPCTFLCNSGVRWLYGGKGTEIDPVRWEQMRAGREFFLSCLAANSGKVCVENPIPHKHANLPASTQYVQPWQFGTPESKKTGLWLRGLKPLVPTHERPAVIYQSVHTASPGPLRWKQRSATFSGIASAMAEQWG